jgi:hypothetical protein
MKRPNLMLLLAAFALTTSVAAHAAGSMGAGKSVVVRGELVDMGCYLGHEAKGEKHKSCATKCIAGGMPMGLLTADGTLYLLTMSHDAADPFNRAKQLAGSMVDVTGPVLERSGVKALEVDAVKAVK